MIRRAFIKRKTKIKKKKAYDELHLWPIFSVFIRLRDSDENGMCRCFTCGLFRHWKQGDAGHGVGRQHKATKYNEINNQFQCKKCNGFEEGRKDQFSVNIDKKYGPGTWDKLLVASRQTCKRGEYEYDILIAHYKKEVEKLKAERGIK
jgi:hypothetical protein